jgi:acyl-coenzyme A synthetase/AMP-(fatty) acid ligase
MTTYKQLYQSSIQDPEDFWAEQASALSWFEFPKTILSKDEQGYNRWFEGGKLNLSYLALDQHVEAGKGDEIALYYDSPATGLKEAWSYRHLLSLVEKTAGGLKRLDVSKGDTVVIYMPMVPEAVASMLACARIGAIHSVVFGGFAAHELALRINDANPKVIISASCGIELQKVIPYKPLLDQAIEEATHKPKQTLILQRPQHTATLMPDRDYDFHEFVAASEPAAALHLEATDPLYILYTSGTTGTPKGIVRDAGGYAVALHFSMKHIYGIQPGEVFWAASDVGWVVGHSYIVYGPLIYGCPTVLYEGKPIKSPDAGVFWRVISEYGVKVMFTAPTAIRVIKKEDPEAELMKKYDLSCLRFLFLAGERCDPATYHWAAEHLGIPVVDHWWQTETGWPMVANMMGVEALQVKPGSSSVPVCGYQVEILAEDGSPLPAGKEGYIAVKLPLPPGCLPTLWGNHERFKAGYLNTFPGYYLTGDGGYQDGEGYIYIMGRVDDVINVAGHRLSTGEMEEVLAAHPDVAECAVIGIEDDLRGQVPIGFVVLKEGRNFNEALEEQLIRDVRDKVGAFAYFRKALPALRLPKTRSGKILRNTMRKIADAKPYTMPSTIEDPEVLNEIKALMLKHAVGKAFETTKL